MQLCDQWEKKILKVISTIISSHKNSRKAMKNPEFQRTDGDWINFKIPGTDLSIPMIQTGFGDGVYPAYFGYDENKISANWWFSISLSKWHSVMKMNEGHL